MPNMSMVAQRSGDRVLFYNGSDFVRGRGLLLPAAAAVAVARAFWTAGDASVFIMDL